MTIFEYNGLINDFVARSLHFFERENYRTSSILGTPANLRPVINLDPEGRMVSVRVFTSHLALLPLGTSDHHEGTSNNEEQLQSHVVSFATQIDSRLKVVRNLIFLPGFLNPTIAILYDRASNEGENDGSMPLRTLLNHCDPSHPKETCAVMIVAIEPVLKYRATRADSSPFQFTVVNRIEGVPFDAEGLHALPKPVGGLFITCSNLLLWCDISCSTAPYSIALNQFAQLTYSARISISQFQSLNLSSLLDSQFLALQPAHGNVLKCIFITKLGEKLLVSIARTGQTLGFFNIERIEKGARVAPSPTDLIQITEESVFISSEGGNSQLLSLYSKNKNKDTSFNSVDTADTAVNMNNSKQPTKVELNDDIDAFLYGDDVDMTSSSSLRPPPPPTDDDYLMTLEREEQKIKQPVNPKTKSQSNGPIVLEFIEELQVLGPIIDLAVGSSDSGSTELVTIGGSFTDAQTGKFHAGSINILTQRIPAVIQLSFNLPETQHLWTINNSSDLGTKFLVASTTSSTLVLTTSQARIVELEESDFYLEGPTLYCSTIANDFIIQIFPTGMKLLALADARIVSEIQGDFSGCHRAMTSADCLYCLFTDGALRIYSAASLQLVRTLSEVTAFTLENDNLFLSHNNGALTISRGEQVIFENSFFSRLPVTLTNQVNKKNVNVIDNVNISLSQKVISLDVLQESVLVVRYESQKSIGLVSYRYSDVLVLQRITSESLGIFSSMPQGAESVNFGNELFMFLPDTPVHSFALNSRSFPRLHTLLSNDSEDAKIVSLAAYYQSGNSSLMMLKDNGTVSIVDLQKTRKRFDLDWQSGWYLKRVALEEERAPTHVTYHPPSKTYLVASAELASDFILPTDEYSAISDTPNISNIASSTGSPKLFGSTSNALHLLNPLSWTIVDALSDNFLPFEGVTCIRCLELETKQTATGFSPFLTVGTAYQKGEDRPIRGRAFVFDVAEVVPEPGKPETNRKLRLKGVTDFKGPVMAFTPLRQGNVAISAGAKVIVNTFEEDEKFAGVAFHDIGTCTLALASLKNFFITADLVNSVAFFAFQAEPLARIHELGRDFGQNLQCSSVEFLVNSSGQVMTVLADDQGGLHFFSYAPNSKITSLCRFIKSVFRSYD